MKAPISTHFENLDAPLVNINWSWGAQRPDGKVLLRAWNDERLKIDGQWYRLLLNPEWNTSTGYPERIRHLELIRNGAPGYMVILHAADKDKQPRAIESYNAGVVVPIGNLHTTADGKIYGECLQPVPVAFLGLK